MSSGFSPRVCSAPAIYRSRTTVTGFMREHQTSPKPDIDDFTRIDINVGAGVSSQATEDVSSPCRHEFRLYAVYYTAGVCRQCRNNGAFHVPPTTKVFAVRPSQVRTWHGFGSLFRHRYLRVKECLHWIRYSFDANCRALFEATDTHYQYLFNIENIAAKSIRYQSIRYQSKYGANNIISINYIFQQVQFILLGLNRYFNSSNTVPSLINIFDKDFDSNKRAYMLSRCALFINT